jgi:hypothetical protein
MFVFFIVMFIVLIVFSPSAINMRDTTYRASVISSRCSVFEWRGGSSVLNLYRALNLCSKFDLMYHMKNKNGLTNTTKIDGWSSGDVGDVTRGVNISTAACLEATTQVETVEHSVRVNPTQAEVDHNRDCDDT